MATPSSSIDRSARDRVHRRLATLVRRFPELPIGSIDVAGLEPRDAAFARAIEDEALRRWLTLRFLLNQSSDKPLTELEPRVQAVLFAGAAQLLFMRSVPARAAIHESVEWAKRCIRPGAGGLVNAVLRRLSRLLEQDDDGDWRRRDAWANERDEIPRSDGGSLILAEAILPTDPIERLEATTSHPRELLRRCLRSMSMREVRSLAAHGLAKPPVILNTQHARDPLPGPPTLTPHDAPGHHVFHGDIAQLQAMLDQRSDVWVQDPASSLAVQSVSDLQPRVIMDICAGQGTKTRQLARMFPEASIIASDIDRRRLDTLRGVFAHEPRVQCPNYGELSAWSNQSDLILIDAPCSNTGVLARRLEARYRFSEPHTQSLIQTQRQLLADSIRLLSPAGAILYSSCSLDPRENESHVDWAERWHGLEAKRSARRLPTGLPGDPPQRYSDGAFATLLAR